VRQTLLALKESGRTDVAKPLGLALAPALGRAVELASPGDSSVEVAAVPTSKAAWRRRGYDPVALLCRRAGFDLARVLVHERQTSAQKTLDAGEREHNLRNSMRARRPLDGRRFLLVDDVVTTGATFFEAARAVREAGGEVVGGAALAFTPRIFGAQPRLLRHSQNTP
jgi:predicted amidophosphoribosyltransferase